MPSLCSHIYLLYKILHIGCIFINKWAETSQEYITLIECPPEEKKVRSEEEALSFNKTIESIS